MVGEVKAWSETVIIPTYKIGKPEKNPLFLEKRVYQGSSGAVYPYPVIERVYDEKEERAYTALFLENDFLKIMVLPELGGRVQMAIDKTNNYLFIYYNRVIKPALVGLTGPWISGGIEFNWPQHHRPSTFLPLDWRIDENMDGSKTIWCTEIERMSRMKGMHGLTLYPHAAYLEVSVQLYNRTNLPQTFLWWANPAVHANENTQAVFPPDVKAVMDHGKRAVSSFPIAKGVYYKVDYSPGTDISWYKNLPVPTSYMAYHSNYDFLGSYDHGKQAGMIHVADHHIVPGKKLWTWGAGDFGQTWDRQLTDEDGPYLELMCGAYSDNQPDFSWLMPGEEKSFKQYFFPYKKIGVPKNANRDVVLSLDVQGSTASMGVYVTHARKVRIVLSGRDRALFETTMDLSPEMPFTEKIPLPGDATESLKLTVYEGNLELLSFALERAAIESPLPEPAKAVDRPEAIPTVEGLYLAGLHLEQYRHATYSADRYYQEGIRRDPLNFQCHTALGKLYYRRGQLDLAEKHLRQAIAGITKYNQNPFDGEAFYTLGLVLSAQARYDDAWDIFYKAVWNAAWQDAGYFELAKIACRKERFEEALEFTRRALRRNYLHHKARHLRIAILRQQGQTNAALREASLALELDRLEYGAMWEKYLLIQDGSFERYVHQNSNALIEIALDYAAAGMYLEAIALLRRIPNPNPVVEYLLGWCHLEDGDKVSALSAFKNASLQPADYVFPNHMECVQALKSAISLNPSDDKAYYYLGTYYYAHQNYAAAQEFWEKSYELNPNFPTVCRNLGLMYFNKLNQPEKALEVYERAFELDPGDARVFYELDQLYKRLNHPPQGRLMRLETYAHLVEQRDDLTIEYVSLLNLHSRYHEALQILLQRTFHPWEGGEGKVVDQYVLALVELAKTEIAAGNFTQALAYLDQARAYPPNLGEGKLYGRAENQIYYYMGVAYDGLGVPNEAKYYYRSASYGEIDLNLPQYYNDSPVSNVYYQGLALNALNRSKEAISLFMKMIAFGERHLDDPCEPDYFAVSLPTFQVFDDDLQLRNQIHCYYLMGLGYLGLHQHERALYFFDQILKADASHQGVVIHKQIALADL